VIGSFKKKGMLWSMQWRVKGKGKESDDLGSVFLVSVKKSDRGQEFY